MTIPMMAQPPIGLANELAFITLDEVCRHLDNYLGNFILDDIAAIVYANRFLNAPDFESVPKALPNLFYCLSRAAEYAPYDESLLQILQQISPTDVLTERLAFLKRIAPNTELKSRVENLFNEDKYDKAQRLLLEQLDEMPACIWAAAWLLREDSDAGRRPGAWLSKFKCPPKLLPVWNTLLFAHYAIHGFTEEAAGIWEQLDASGMGPYCLNLAAEVFFSKGDRAKASGLYMKSLKMDPRQAPIRHRLEAIANPFVPDMSLLETRSANIYLYSWNKADFLEKTLLGLAKTNIGKARIRLLLNGCTDDSEARVQRIKEEFFKDSMEIISLPVNIGAPAARNWLIALPETREADYTAFLDDDVDVDTNWLAGLLTTMEAYPKAGVAGCKVINPGTPVKLQYLYRNPTIIRKDLFRISLDVPPVKHDTGLYNVIRTTSNVMGCCHVFRKQALLDCPTFDIRFSPSQMDDIAHDFELILKGYDVVYCGHVTCVHHQNTGKANFKKFNIVQHGNVIGNDFKFFFKFYDVLEQFKTLVNT